MAWTHPAPQRTDHAASIDERTTTRERQPWHRRCVPRSFGPLADAHETACIDPRVCAAANDNGLGAGEVRDVRRADALFYSEMSGSSTP